MKLSKTSILLGWPTRSEARRKANANKVSKLSQKRNQKDLAYALQYTGDGHLVSFAPTGSGKGVSSIIPNLLYYKGPVIVIDPKGENFAVTARFRKSLGQSILLLDPFKAVDDNLIESHGLVRDRLNPLDLGLMPGASIENDAQMIADLLSGGGTFSTDPFWDICARKLLSGLVAHEMDVSLRENRAPSISTIVDILFADDAVYSLAVMLDTQAPSKFVSRCVASGFLGIADKTRDGVLVTAQSYLSLLASGDLLQHLENSTIDLASIQERDDYTLFIVIPPTKLESHSVLLRIWVSVLMHAIMERNSFPSKGTLFMLDECANLGRLDVLKKAVTLLRGYGLQAWMFFQDLSQMEELYGGDFLTMINNCGVLQTFGISRLSAARPLAEVIGEYKGEEILRLSTSQQILSMAQRRLKVSRRLKYYKDEAFEGRFDENPLIRVEPSPFSNTLLSLLSTKSDV
jgi:type IV secretion system protein VirD4